MNEEEEKRREAMSVPGKKQPDQLAVARTDSAAWCGPLRRTHAPFLIGHEVHALIC